MGNYLSTPFWHDSCLNNRKVEYSLIGIIFTLAEGKENSKTVRESE